MIHGNSLQPKTLGMLSNQTPSTNLPATNEGERQRGKLALVARRKNSAFILVAILGAKALSFFLVLRQRFFNDFDRRIRRADVIYLDLFAFQ